MTDKKITVKKKIILDTDMGVDCDDAAALAILLNKQSIGEIEILCVTASSTREGATGTIRAIADYYGAELKIGAMAYPALECDKINNYGKIVKDTYGTKDSDRDAVDLLRETLSEQEEKITFISIGPLTNLSRLLQSEGDCRSDLNGIELVKEKVDIVYCMGGSFEQNKSRADFSLDVQPEWNILQDVFSARYVTENCPVGIVFLPFEAGSRVMTRMDKGKNPVWFSMKNYAISEHFSYEPVFERMSWDPVTCLCATDGCEEYYDYSPEGKISVDERGNTVFTEGGGRDRIVLLKDGYLRIEELVNSMIPPVRKQ